MQRTTISELSLYLAASSRYGISPRVPSPGLSRPFASFCPRPDPVRRPTSCPDSGGATLPMGVSDGGLSNINRWHACLRCCTCTHRGVGGPRRGARDRAARGSRERGGGAPSRRRALHVPGPRATGKGSKGERRNPVKRMVDVMWGGGKEMERG
ncbi:hypothetical protein BHM03_00048900 [Ensete ventricosum]|uniref:Uncharacterized protein n=1 Tax=Ensete ventricosum TaxID=4639 RepID=A0A445MLC3_ENSVE|nr:hypothetical protein BHM03_00048900 [Ensete ventricosum]